MHASLVIQNLRQAGILSGRWSHQLKSWSWGNWHKNSTDINDREALKKEILSLSWLPSTFPVKKAHTKRRHPESQAFQDRYFCPRHPAIPPFRHSAMPPCHDAAITPFHYPANKKTTSATTFFSVAFSTCDE